MCQSRYAVAITSNRRVEERVASLEKTVISGCIPVKPVHYSFNSSDPKDMVASKPVQRPSGLSVIDTWDSFTCELDRGVNVNDG